MQSGAQVTSLSDDKKLARYNRFLLLVAGLGGLLYGIDVGIVGGAVPYLEATSHLSPGELSIIVAAVLLGSVFSTLFAGILADWMGRKPLMIVSGVAFTVSIPVIALSQSYSALFFGRLLQGMSGGLVGVVIPLYLAECLSADKRGRGTAVFQWMLTLGIFAAAIIGVLVSYHVDSVARIGSADAIFQVKDHAWRSIFWMSMPPGILFVITSFFISESPRWLFRRGKQDQAHAALLRSRTADQAALELREMGDIASEAASKTTSHGRREPLFQRRFILPFLLACVILSCNTATGINSIVGFNTNILISSGLSDVQAHWGYVLFTMMNFLFTTVGMTLVDKKGRKFLFLLGTSGIIVSLSVAALLFMRSEKNRVDVAAAVQPLVTSDQKLTFHMDEQATRSLSVTPTGAQSLWIVYSYGDFTGSTIPVTLGDSASAVDVNRGAALPGGKVQAFFQNPFADLDAARTAPLHIDHAFVQPIPSAANGWLMAICLYLFVAFYATGPGVCVWLALSELMPTRIRSNGMSIALVLNQLVSTTLAAVFLPVVGKHGYSSMFFVFVGCTVVYFLTVLLFLPETKGKTLEEIEKHFETA
ncbi:sugar porter family MFS transporter [Occallatibacter riparius]|uniref:Sugar porter family MFS transporter n=1 Tax=Occallatibacter riparius TaxID=1002689 RepID=A0A9J7BGT2_9BACT|nr:sugar porter family MFS transporter [Occallatibacter riparius]UWZ81729.1 sugar porter family MFS transporter [Occallatibacter riparius]